MNPSSFLGRSFNCECGRAHRVPLREVIYAPNAAAQLPAAVRRLAPGAGRITLLADTRTHAAAGRACGDALRNGGLALQTLIVPDPAPGISPVCDDLTLRELQARMPPADLLLAAGAGVISDLTKWLARESGLPYMTFATAASMNGYASSNIAPAIDGVKRVVEGVSPIAVIADPAILAAAPRELTAAGLGDVLAKPVSICDWQISNLLFGEYYCPVCARMIRDLEPGYRRHPAGLARGDPAAMEALFQALIYSGVSMTMAATSFPASGGEHLISHALDMIAMERGLRHDYHGRQVGLGTIFAAALYQRLLDLPAPEFREAAEPTDAAYWGRLAAEVENEHARKRRRAAAAAGRLRTEPELWPRLRRIITDNHVAPAEIKQCLAAAGAAHRVEDIGCTRAHFMEAAVRCHQLRERYTVIDLARAAGILPAAAAEIANEFL